MVLNTTKVIELEDSIIVAYLFLKGHRFIPTKREDGRVVFRVEGDISEDLQEIYQNVQVGILDFIKSLKAIRSSIFALKGSGQ
jgi:hypothetical protein